MHFIVLEDRSAFSRLSPTTIDPQFLSALPVGFATQTFLLLAETDNWIQLTMIFPNLDNRQ